MNTLYQTGFGILSSLFFGQTAEAQTTGELASFSHALSALNAALATSVTSPANNWPPTSWPDWLKKQGLISNEAKIPNTLATLYRVKVVPQIGLTCGFNEGWNLTWFLALLTSKTPQEGAHALSALKNSNDELTQTLSALKKQAGITNDLELCVPMSKRLDLLANYHQPAPAPTLPSEEQWPTTVNGLFQPIAHQTLTDSLDFSNNLERSLLSYSVIPKLVSIAVNGVGAFGFRLYRESGVGHYFALAFLRASHEYSFFILDSLNVDGPVEDLVYKKPIQELISTLENPAKLFEKSLQKPLQNLKSAQTLLDSYNSPVEAAREIANAEYIISLLGKLFDPHGAEYIKKRDALIARIQQVRPELTLEQIRKMKLRGG